MNELVQIHQVMFGEDKVNATDSRELYKKLGLAKGQYSRWIETYLNEYDFESGFDYIEVDMDVEVNPLSRAKNSVIISTDMAKEICMMTNNEIGSKIRKYYISLERKQCDTSKHQLETAHTQIKELQLGKRKVYKDGFIALSTYLKRNNISMSVESAFDMLSKIKVVGVVDVMTPRKVLLDDNFGRQEHNEDNYGVIEFNTRSLDLVFRNYIKIEPNLFDVSDDEKEI